MLKKILSMIVCVSMLMAVSACGNKDNKDPESTPSASLEQTQKTETIKTDTPKQTEEDSKLYEDAIEFTIELENGGVMKGELYPNLAPITVKNFTKLVKDKFYDGLIFHRVIEGFMIQGGGYDKDMIPKETDSIKGEFTANGFENNLKHTKGVLSMARTNVPDSASSQFFIMHEDSPHLDGQYAAFGRITEGLDIVDEIATTETATSAYGMSDVPVEPIIIKTITLD